MAKQQAAIREEDPFLDPDYERPQSGGNYMKFKDGENRFRILARPILGWVGWTENAGKRSPVRKRMGEEFAPGEVIVDAKNKVRHFWAMPVYNYGTGTIQILELTQSTVQEAVEALTKNAKWGSPLHYDLCVTRSGEGMDTSYSTMPEPKAPLDEAAAELWKLALPRFNLNALYDNGDPFDSAPAAAPGAAPVTPEGQALKRFWVLAQELVKIGAIDATFTDPGVDGKKERRKFMGNALGRQDVIEVHQLTADDWAKINGALEMMRQRSKPADDSDIPF